MNILGKTIWQLILKQFWIVPHGKNRHTGRITGGLDAAQGQFPYQASIRNMFGLHFCGGSILNENHILTAASCVVDSNPANIHVVVGSNVASSGTRYNIASISAHADYNRKTHENDIAVIRTTNPIYMSSNVGKVAIADQEILEGPLLTLGWGRNSTNGEATRTLQFLVTKLLPKEECKNRIPVYDDTICTFCEYLLSIKSNQWSIS